MGPGGRDPSHEELIGNLAKCEQLAEELLEQPESPKRDLALELLQQAQFRILQTLARQQPPP
jgi:hypothetical protein